jgi:hypothetical protein
MNALYLWACMAFTSWTECIVLEKKTYYDHYAYVPHKNDAGLVSGYRIIFWDIILEDFVERHVPEDSVRFY